MLMLKALHTHRQPGVGSVEGGAAVVCMGCLIKLLWRWRVCAVTAVWRLKICDVHCAVTLLVPLHFFHPACFYFTAFFSGDIYSSIMCLTTILCNFDRLWKKMHISYLLDNSCHSRPNRMIVMRIFSRQNVRTWDPSLRVMCEVR